MSQQESNYSSPLPIIANLKAHLLHECVCNKDPTLVVELTPRCKRREDIEGEILWGHVKGSRYPSSLSKCDAIRVFNLLRVRLSCVILMVVPMRVERFIFECNERDG